LLHMATTNLAAEWETMTDDKAILAWYAAWRERVEANAVTRMRFASLRFVVYLRRENARREAMRTTVVGYEVAHA
jgi:hypothetical protein